jgi:hypothetical protein
VTTSGTRGSKGLADGVALGVDTHLDFHVAVVWPAPGRGQGSNDWEGLRETPPLDGGVRASAWEGPVATEPVSPVYTHATDGMQVATTAALEEAFS